MCDGASRLENGFCAESVVWWSVHNFVAAQTQTV